MYEKLLRLLSVGRGSKWLGKEKADVHWACFWMPSYVNAVPIQKKKKCLDLNKSTLATRTLFLIVP